MLIALEEAPAIPDYWLGYLEALLAAGQDADATLTLDVGRRHGLQGAAVEDFARRLGASAAGRTPSPAPSASLVVPSPPPSDRAERRRNEKLLRKWEGELIALLKRGKFADAKRRAEAITQGFPDNGLGWKTLGALQWADQQKAEAVTAMRTAVSLVPEDPEAHRNLGVALGTLDQYEEAERHLLRAAALDPKDALTQCSVADLYQLTGRNAEAEARLREAMRLQPGDGRTVEDQRRHTSLLFMMSHDPNVNAVEWFEEHRRYGEKLESALRASWPRHKNSRDPARRLKVGFVSADFNNHAVASFFEPLVIHLHQHADLELFAYYNNHAVDDMTGRLQQHFDHWRVVLNLSDTQLVRAILDDQIDILVDLSGHSTLNRLPAFAYKPAPIQASWIGYPGTTGLTAVDYYLADSDYLPPGRMDHLFTEKMVLLPANAPFQPYAASPAINALPAVRTGHLTFGSFNRLGKISADTVDSWAALMQALPDARLVIGGIRTDNADNNPLSARLVAAGVALDRVSYYMRGNMDAYLALHHQVDICLDTYPYSGGTTTYHALWMGVPTLTIEGPTPPGLQGAAVARHMGLEGFVAADRNDFVAKGLYWSRHVDQLAAIRAEIRERWRQMDNQKPEIIAAGVHRALRYMWTRWCEGNPPVSFHA